MADYHNLIYYKDASGLYVNLYVPSEVTWGEIKVVQETGYPDTETSTLTLEMNRSTSFPLRFRVPLWANDVSLKVNGVAVTQSDLSQGYVWEGEIAAKQKVEINVKYRNQGAQTWNYDFGARREPIRNFKLNVTAPRAVKFLRGRAGRR